MNRRNVFLGLAAAPLAATGVVFAQSPAAGNGPTGAALQALLTTTTGGVANFVIQRFAVVNGTLSAIGTLTGTATDGSTVVTTTALPVVASNPSLDPPPGATCPILDLTIGPIHLDLLGLVIDISSITIHIVAVSGPGNLLGNLLCAIANLLNPTPTGGLLNQLANLLNQLLGAI